MMNDEDLIWCPLIELELSPSERHDLRCECHSIMGNCYKCKNGLILTSLLDTKKSNAALTEIKEKKNDNI